MWRECIRCGPNGHPIIEGLCAPCYGHLRKLGREVSMGQKFEFAQPVKVATIGEGYYIEPTAPGLSRIQANHDGKRYIVANHMIEANAEEAGLDTGPAPR
jgi:hypothetical protein